MPKVYNRHHRNEPSHSVYVGRPSKWGNPHPVEPIPCPRCSKEKGKEIKHTREAAITLYIREAEASIGFKDRVKRDLRGENLVCWCSPLPCHADYLLRVANEP